MEKWFRMIVEHSADGIFITDEKGKYVYVNPKACEMLRYSFEELTNMTIADISGKEDIGKKLENFENLKKTEEMYKEILLKRKDGSTFWADLNATALPNGQMYGSCRDITERKKMEEELLKTKKFLGLINGMLRHDITNDLTVILSALELYKEGDKTMLEEIKKRTLKSIEFINSMQRTDYLIEKHQLDLHGLKSVFKNLKNHYLNLVINIDDQLQKINVLADDSLSSTFDNIISNSIKHGEATIINITAEKISKDIVKIKINNNGKPIEKNLLPYIFEEEVRSSITGNTGLGLYIVQENITRWGGEVSAENEKDGVNFYLTFKTIKVD